MVHDFRFALRSFSRRPAFTVVVLLTLAIGIGSNVAIFSVANAVLFKPLPYLEPDRLVLVWNRSGTADSGRSMVSGPDYLDYRDQTTLFEDFAGAFAMNGTLTGEGRATQLMMGWSTVNLFKVLGVRPVVGRDFAREDETFIDPQAFLDPAADIPPGVLLLSHRLWRQQFGADPTVLGRILEMDGQACRVVGVLPPDFRIYLPADAGMPTDVDVWRVIPVAFDTNPREAPWLTVVARLKQGVTLEAAQAQMDSVAARLREQYQFHANAGRQIELNSMHRDVVEHVRPTLFALLAAGAFVLLIACANVANLLIGRAAARQQEIAVRASMGAGQARIVRQMLIESGVLSLAGGLLGLGLAWTGVRVLLAAQPDNLPRLENVSLDVSVVLFAVGSTLLAALLFGLAPALRSARPDLALALKERGSETGGIRGNKLRTALVVVEVALSLVLLVGAGLLLRSYTALQDVEPGFRADGLLTFSAPLPAFKYRELDPRTNFMLRLRDRLLALPGVEAVGGVTPLPLAGGDQYFVFSYGKLDATEDEWNRNRANYRWTIPGYFESMGIPLVAGRPMTDTDNRESAFDVVVVDEKLAERVWPGQDPVGRQLRIERFDPNDFTMGRAVVRVVGVVGHVRAESLDADGREAIYFPHRSFPFAPQSFAVRVASDPMSLGPLIRREVEALDPDVPVADVRLMQEYISEATAQARFTLTLIGVFAALSLVLAAVGLYGVLSYSVQQRTREIGVRMAFGAERGSILRLIVGQGILVAAAGVAAGLLVAVPLTRLASSLLYRVTASDPLTFAGVSIGLIGVAVVASYLPARRATRVDPLEALRGELASASKGSGSAGAGHAPSAYPGG